MRLRNNPLSFSLLYWRALSALRQAARQGLPGVAFARFGRQAGLRLAMRGARLGLHYLLTPVNIFRYFEMPFVLSCLPTSLRRGLDLSSPRLFSLYLARQRPAASIAMLNPDYPDYADTLYMVSRLGLSNVTVACLDAAALAASPETYDCIWSISVLEHIAGAYDDRHAVRLLYDALAPGGRLILTVMVDRTFWNEYRDRQVYSTQPEESPGRYFFQRFYDRQAISERLLAPIGARPSLMRWFGETTRGRHADYERRWMRQGHRLTVEDPLEIVGHWREFEAWEEMPGRGVCGLMIEKAGERGR
jgi:SAM-dependent methyltransferase